MPKTERGDYMFLILWVIVAVALAILEVFTTGFFAIWFSIGAAITAILSALFPELHFAIQLVIFIVSSLILFLLTRNKIKRKVEKNGSQPVYSILGKHAIVTKEIDSIKGTGQISINGDIWSAKSKDSEFIIPLNSKVEVLEIDGVKAVVRLIESPKDI